MAISTKVTVPKQPKSWLPAGGGAGGGALLGLKIGGPVGALFGMTVGGIVGWVYGDKLAALLHTSTPPASMQEVSHVTQGGTTAPPAVPHATTAQQVAENGKAKAAAAALYAYLKVHGPDGTSDLAQLVSDFQGMSNSDSQALGLTGPIPISATYDVKTSAALTIYTHDPIPPATAPAIQPPPTAAQTADIYLPGSAATSGFNLYTYLQKNGNKPSDLGLQRMVHQFQIDVNHDPKFPGPAAHVGQGILAIIIKSPLPENGVYDAATAKALKVMSG